LVIGCYMFLEFRRIKYEFIFIIGIIGLIPLLSIMDYYRNTEEFRQTDIRNIFQKIGTLKEGMQLKKDREETSEKRLTQVGISCIGTTDALVYEQTPAVIPFEGLAHLDALLWLYVPYMLSSSTDRPMLQDGPAIGALYTGKHYDRSSVQISWPAELYRRWGWAAIPVGLLIYGLFYGTIFRFAFRLYLFRNALWGFMVCGLLFNFFIAWFWSTTLTMSWYWFYDIPKHLLLLGGLYSLLKVVLGASKPRGVLMYTGEVDGRR